MIYRDGVGDGNFSIVKNHEVESIVVSCHLDVYMYKCNKYVYITVQFSTQPE